MSFASLYNAMQPVMDFVFGIPLNDAELRRLARLAHAEHSVYLLTEPLDVPLIHASEAREVIGRAYPRGSKVLVKISGMRHLENGLPYVDSVEFELPRDCV